MPVETLGLSNNLPLGLGANGGYGGFSGGQAYSPASSGIGYGDAYGLGSIGFGDFYAQGQGYGQGQAPTDLLSGQAGGQGQNVDTQALMQWISEMMAQTMSMLQQLLPYLTQGGGNAQGLQGLGSGLPMPGGATQGSLQTPVEASQPATNPATATADPVTPVQNSAAVGDGPSAGSGPRTFNITNNQDKPITLGLFDQGENLIGEITLQPGQTGQMHYQNDFTGLIKQANASGEYQWDASRLEFYNGFINTSYIDGRNASIYATDHNGFEIGDQQSILDKAPADIVSRDAGGNPTITGWYDGSSGEMTRAGEFLEGELGTGMSYIHPNDDQRGEGQNPMRHTDAMTLDVVFGKP